MPSFSARGVAINYIDEAAEATKPMPVLLVHGFASNLEINWGLTGWIGELKRSGYRVVAFDNRGHGKSEKLYGIEDYGAPLMADDAAALLDHLGIRRAHVIGYSMGARIAAFLALAHPARVESLVFGGLGINLVRGLGGTDAIAQALEAPSLDDVTTPVGRTFRAFADQTKSDLPALAACIRSSRAPISADAVGAIRCPVLIAVGEKDEVAGAAGDLAALIPGARAFIIPNREHMKAVGDKAFKGEVLTFFEGIEPA